MRDARELVLLEEIKIRIKTKREGDTLPGVFSR